jgi:hypothetical protein
MKKNFNINEHDLLMVELVKSLENNFFQLYEKIKVGETPKEL